MSEIMDPPHDTDSAGSVSDESDEPTDDGSENTAPQLDADTVITYLQWGALFAFALTAVVAGVGLYTSLGSIIDVWVAREYRPFARTGLNFALLAFALGGLATVIRRL